MENQVPGAKHADIQSQNFFRIRFFCDIGGDHNHTDDMAAHYDAGRTRKMDLYVDGFYRRRLRGISGAPGKQIHIAIWSRDVKNMPNKKLVKELKAKIEALIIAIPKELEAYEHYINLANEYEDPASKEMFIFLSRQELAHKDMLERILMDLQERLEKAMRE